MAQVNLNVTELKGFINHIITNNRFLTRRKERILYQLRWWVNQVLVKLQVQQKLAQENDLKFVKLNLAQIEELGDLVGFPVRQFQMYKEKTSTKQNR